MHVVLSMAMSIDGVIATANGSEDFLSHRNWIAFSELVAEHGAFIVGRKTYEIVQNWKDGYNFDSFPGALKIVISKRNDYQLTPGFELAASPKQALEICSDRGFSSCIVTGGGEINAAFLSAKLVNEVIVHIEPVIVGDGIRIFGSGFVPQRLALTATKDIGDGILQLRYRVDNS